MLISVHSTRPGNSLRDSSGAEIINARQKKAIKLLIFFLKMISLRRPRTGPRQFIKAFFTETRAVFFQYSNSGAGILIPAGLCVPKLRSLFRDSCPVAREI